MAVSYAQWSAGCFGLYLVTLGSAINIAPNTVHRLFQSTVKSGKLPPPGGWLPAFGTFGVMYVGFFYLTAARYNLRPIFWMTAIARLTVLPLTHCLCVLAGTLPVAALEAFIPTDALTAVHMLYSLRRDRLLAEKAK